MDAGSDHCEIDGSLLIREIAVGDAEAAAQLSGQLGYAASVDAIRERIESIRNSGRQAVYVACFADTVIGWIDVSIIQHFATGEYGEIGGLVVLEEYRSRGVGRRLVVHAEGWVADQGVSRMVVRSRIGREGAHRFYLREGYAQTKTSAVFSKNL